MRCQQEVIDEIAAISDIERGQLIRRIREYDWAQERKESVIKFIMLLGLASGNSKRQ